MIKGVDLRKVGSGNIGATNVLRAMGKGAAIITLAGDVLKGVIPVLAVRYFYPNTGIQFSGQLVSIPLQITDTRVAFEGVIGLAAILGHKFLDIPQVQGGQRGRNEPWRSISALSACRSNGSDGLAAYL